jgi:hypothetical protein
LDKDWLEVYTARVHTWPFLRLGLNPRIDQLAGRLSRPDVIDGHELNAVTFFHERQELGQKNIPLLRLQGIRNAQLDVLHSIQSGLKRGKGGMQPRLFEREMQHRRYLRFGLAA